MVTGTIEDLRTMRDYFSSLLEFVAKEIKAGKSLAGIQKAESVPGFKNMKERWNGAKNMNLEAAFEELNS